MLSVRVPTYASAPTVVDYCKGFMQEAFSACGMILPLYEDS